MTHEYEEGLWYAEGVLELDPHHSVAWEYKTLFLIELERFEEALEASKITILFTPSTDAYIRMSQILYELERYSGALKVAEQALALDSTNYQALAMKAQALEMLGASNFKAAAIRSWEICPDSEANPIAARIMEYLELNDESVKMSKEYQETKDPDKIPWKLEPECVLSLYEAAESDSKYVRKAGERLAEYNYSKACDEALKATRKEPTNALAWRLLGIAHLGQKKYEKAHAACSKAEELDSQREDVWFNLGLANIGLSNYKSAKTCFQNALEVIGPTITPWEDVERLLKLVEKKIEEEQQ